MSAIEELKEKIGYIISVPESPHPADTLTRKIGLMVGHAQKALVLTEAILVEMGEDRTSEVRFPLDSNCKPNPKRPYCYQCGTQVRNQKHCHQCGRKLLWVTPLAVPPCEQQAITDMPKFCARCPGDVMLIEKNGYITCPTCEYLYGESGGKENEDGRD